MTGCDLPVVGTIQPADVRIEFSAGGGDYGCPHKSRSPISNASRASGEVVDPRSLSALRDFVEEWLAAPWTESAARAESLTFSSVGSQTSSR